jgi:S-adenosylmethionine-diacylglycerol 3-amino-3-carboxypropyl transferase
VTITSAGCNALDYLLDVPAHIHAVHMNYRQNALLELKLALIRAGNQKALFEIFGLGATSRLQVIYVELRVHLGPVARKDWDDKISYSIRAR